ncbi:cytochrome P450 2G1 isoform X2 [Saimiri boliviensis]|uniref:cytochrome P450 2G1 isoform X2 n=1 Tax=Saimiri boliviensis TaxID=27679 RepID=UPI003D784D4B
MLCLFKCRKVIKMADQMQAAWPPPWRGTPSSTDHLGENSGIHQRRDGTHRKEKYGPVFTVYMGPRPVVVLCGHEAVKEALVDQADDFSGRGQLASVERNFQGHGVALSNGDRWRSLRRFSLTILRDFGMGKRSIEERIQEEAGYLLEEFRKTKGAPVDPTVFLSRSVSNVISSVVFGSRFDYEDKQFLKLVQLVNESFIEMSTPWTQLYDMYSGIMRYLPGRHHRIYYLIEELKDFVASKVKINEATFDHQNPRDFIDCFLIKMHQDKNNPHTEFNLKNLVLTTLNLFFAGTETVSSTLRYGFLVLMKHPEVEAKIHEEINQVIGPHRLPSVEDRVKMPYTDAVIHEIQRLIDIVPMGVPHNVIRDTQFGGYLLPKVRLPLIASLPLRSSLPRIPYPCGPTLISPNRLHVHSRAQTYLPCLALSSKTPNTSAIQMPSIPSTSWMRRGASRRMKPLCLFPLESASAWVRPWPAWNSFSTSSSSFRTSLSAHWCRLQTSISPPSSQALATSLRPISSALWPAECHFLWRKEEAVKNAALLSCSGAPPSSPS